MPAVRACGQGLRKNSSMVDRYREDDCSRGKGSGMEILYELLEQQEDMLIKRWTSTTDQEKEIL